MYETYIEVKKFKKTWKQYLNTPAQGSKDAATQRSKKGAQLWTYIKFINPTFIGSLHHITPNHDQWMTAFIPILLNSSLSIKIEENIWI